MSGDLFGNEPDGVDESVFDVSADAPLAERMRPRTLEEYAGQRHLVGQGRVLAKALEGDLTAELLDVAAITEQEREIVWEFTTGR